MPPAWWKASKNWIPKFSLSSAFLRIFFRNFGVQYLLCIAFLVILIDFWQNLAVVPTSTFKSLATIHGMHGLSLVAVRTIVGTGSCFRCLPDICFSLLIFLYFFSFLSEICFSLLFLFSLFFPAVWWFFVCFPFFRELFFFADFLFVFTFSFWPFGQRHRQWLWTAKPIFSHCFKVAFSIYHPCIFFSGLLYFS